MKINPVTSRFSSPYYKPHHIQTKQSPSFSSVKLGELSEDEICSLYYDSLELMNIIRWAAPILNERFSDKFDAELNIFPDIDRTIVLNIKASLDNLDNLKKYIVENNDKFKFPQEMIDDYKNNGYSYDRWLFESKYNPLMISLEEKGEKGVIKTIIDFCNDITDEKIVSELYKSYDHNYDKNKNIPSYYWEFPGG